MGIIYRVTNTRNGKVYIGQTGGTLAERWKRHIQGARQGIRSRFYNAIRKHGSDAFVIEQIDSSLLNGKTDRLERMYIKRYGSMNPEVGYNITPGGDGAGRGAEHPSFGKPGPNLGRTFSEAVRQKARLRQLGKPRTEAQKRAVSGKLTGTVRSSETRERQAAAKRGSKNPMFGTTFSQSHRDRLSLAQQLRRKREKNGS